MSHRDVPEDMSLEDKMLMVKKAIDMTMLLRQFGLSINSIAEKMSRGNREEYLGGLRYHAPDARVDDFVKAAAEFARQATLLAKEIEDSVTDWMEEDLNKQADEKRKGQSGG